MHKMNLTEKKPLIELNMRAFLPYSNVLINRSSTEKDAHIWTIEFFDMVTRAPNMVK